MPDAALWPACPARRGSSPVPLKRIATGPQGFQCNGNKIEREGKKSEIDVEEFLHRPAPLVSVAQSSYYRFPGQLDTLTKRPMRGVRSHAFGAAGHAQ